ncbi:MAG: amidohydrolase family protein, partial [Prolixibacteraceae bacterium]|nr:amidohydrolase family protein [Prolixibacteraceae bacterium]
QSPSEVGLAHSYWAYDMIPRLVETGINIMAGTDMPLALLTPGFSLHEELALLVKYGLTPMQAIEAATLKPAEYYGLEDQQGSIAEGMMADLVVLDANPLEDITNTLKINAVMRNGFLHTRDDLDDILSQLEQYGEVRLKK